MYRVDGNYALRYEPENIVPTDGAKLMRCKLVSYGRQMELLVSTWLFSRKGVTSVVPATTSPMPKLE